jgi:hypothetical protein
MNAMLEARIVAASTHGAADGAQGESQAAARTTPLSDGGAGNALTAGQDRSSRDRDSQLPRPESTSNVEVSPGNHQHTVSSVVDCARRGQRGVRRD